MIKICLLLAIFLVAFCEAGNDQSDSWLVSRIRNKRNVNTKDMLKCIKTGQLVSKKSLCPDKPGKCCCPDTVRPHEYPSKCCPEYEPPGQGGSGGQHGGNGKDPNEDDKQAPPGCPDPPGMCCCIGEIDEICCTPFHK